jgi:hypothetical protein
VEYGSGISGRVVGIVGAMIVDAKLAGYVKNVERCYRKSMYVEAMDMVLSSGELSEGAWCGGPRQRSSFGSIGLVTKNFESERQSRLNLMICRKSTYNVRKTLYRNAITTSDKLLDCSKANQITFTLREIVST